MSNKSEEEKEKKSKRKSDNKKIDKIHGSNNGLVHSKREKGTKELTKSGGVDRADRIGDSKKKTDSKRRLEKTGAVRNFKALSRTPKEKLSSSMNRSQSDVDQRISNVPHIKSKSVTKDRSSVSVLTSTDSEPKSKGSLRKSSSSHVLESPSRSNSARKKDVESPKKTAQLIESNVIEDYSTDEIIDSWIQKEENTVVNDATELVYQFSEQYHMVCKKQPKPNVLLTGITGSGKSSLINAIFGQHLAETGTGVPITQHFTKYNSSDMNVVIYDSKGLEHGQCDEFIETTLSFFEKHQNGFGNDSIHVIWYIINTAHSRWESFEERICRELFNRVPLMFILNKADISSEKDRVKIRGIIENMNLQNCEGVFETVAHSSGHVPHPERCPKCNSDDIVIHNKTITMHCQECKFSKSLKPPDGLSELITATVSVLPVVVREAFISSQKVNFQVKEQQTKTIIINYWNDFNFVRAMPQFLKIIAKFMAHLSVIWEFKKHGKSYGLSLAKELGATLKWKDKINLLLHKKFDRQRRHTTALGILWSWCLRSYALRLFSEWSLHPEIEEDDAMEMKCSVYYKKIFSHMNDDNVWVIEEFLTDQEQINNLLDDNGKLVSDELKNLKELFK